jgi:4-carboxymuconolactone decarboxylase
MLPDPMMPMSIWLSSRLAWVVSHKHCLSVQLATLTVSKIVARDPIERTNDLEGTCMDSIQASPALQIMRSGSQASVVGPSDWFTGSVRIDPFVNADEPSRIQAASVTFQPGARSAWHTHPLGQTLIVTAGQGLVQQWGMPAELIEPGDVIWTPPGIKHWHGATTDTSLTHIAITEKLDGKNVDWLEHVSEEQYQTGCAVCDSHQQNGRASVSPALDKYERTADLGARDRSLVTVAVLIARNQSTDLAKELDDALNNGVTPKEISEAIAHLGFYAGWPNAKSAATIAKAVFTGRHIAEDSLPSDSPTPLPLNEQAESLLHRYKFSPALSRNIEPVLFWGPPTVVEEFVASQADDTPVNIVIEYIVPPGNQSEFRQAVEQLKRSRLRAGAMRWEFCRDSETLDKFVESFVAENWQQHLRHHEQTLEEDRVIENRVHQLLKPGTSPKVSHWTIERS